MLSAGSHKLASIMLQMLHQWSSRAVSQRFLSNPSSIEAQSPILLPAEGDQEAEHLQQLTCPGAELPGCRRRLRGAVCPSDTALGSRSMSSACRPGARPPMMGRLFSLRMLPPAAAHSSKQLLSCRHNASQLGYLWDCNHGH